MNSKKIPLIIGLGILLSLGQSAVNAGLLGKVFGPAPVRLDDSPAPEKAVSTDSFKPLKDCKKVVVTAFNVQFITKKKANAQAGREMEGAAHVNSDIKLTGLDNATFQAITDQTYTNFLKSLTELGVEVMPYSEFAALPEYADMKSYLKDSPLEIEGGTFSTGLPSLMFAPTGMPVPLYGDEFAVNTGAKMAAGMGRSTPNNLEPDLAKKNGFATVHIYWVVEFCQMEASGGTFSFSARVDTKPQISLSKISRCSFFFSNTMSGRQNAKLKNDAFGTDNYVSELKDVTSTGQKVGDAAAELIGVLGGSGGTYKTTSYEAAADPKLYQAACVKYISAAQDLLVAGIKTKLAK